VVCLSFCLSVGLSATVVSRAKTDEPIEMPFGLWTRVGPKNQVLDRVHISLMELAVLMAKDAAHCIGCALGWAQGTVH